MNFSNHFNTLSSSIFTSSSLPPLIKADTSFPKSILSEFDLSYVSKTARTLPITATTTDLLKQTVTFPVELTIKTEPSPPNEPTLIQIQHKQHRITSTNTSLIQVPEHYSTDDADEKKLVDLINDPDLSGWKEAITKKGLTVYSKKIEGSSSLLLKTEATIPYPIQTIITAINNINIRRKWDKSFSKIELIETITDNANYSEETLYLYMKFPLFLPDRDWIQRKKCWINYCNNANTVLFHYKSVEHPQYPPKSKPVRAEMIIGGQYIIQTAPNTCKITMINHADVKIGSTLQGAVNKKAPETPRDFILNLIKGCEMV